MLLLSAGSPTFEIDFLLTKKSVFSINIVLLIDIVNSEKKDYSQWGNRLTFFSSDPAGAGPSHLVIPQERDLPILWVVIPRRASSAWRIP
jgi:hypothetical protein